MPGGIHPTLVQRTSSKQSAHINTQSVDIQHRFTCRSLQRCHIVCAIYCRRACVVDRECLTPWTMDWRDQHLKNALLPGLGWGGGIATEGNNRRGKKAHLFIEMIPSLKQSEMFPWGLLSLEWQMPTILGGTFLLPASKKGAKKGAFIYGNNGIAKTGYNLTLGFSEYGMTNANRFRWSVACLTYWCIAARELCQHVRTETPYSSNERYCYMLMSCKCPAFRKRKTTSTHSHMAFFYPVT